MCFSVEVLVAGASKFNMLKCYKEKNNLLVTEQVSQITDFKVTHHLNIFN